MNLTEKDKELIDLWRQNYAPLSDDDIDSFNWCSVDELLTYWGKAKSNHLFNLFEDELILSKEVKYEKCRDELEDDMSAMTWSDAKIGRKNRNGYQFVVSFNKWLDVSNVPAEDRICLRTLIYADSLVNNIYSGDEIDLTLPNGKLYKIRAGAKIMKILGTLAEAYNLEGFEDFRICHSYVLNDKTLTGNLGLSIHPLDYMTMSDNDSGWDSCMNWCEVGGYRRGTVEMMNSSTVIVAYLAASTPMEIPGREYWNNKKWRCLFVVDKGIILAVKNYPFYNPFLTKLALNWIKELAKKNLGWEFSEIENLHPDIIADKYSLVLELETGSMYDDYGRDEEHLGCFRTDKPIKKEDCYYYKIMNKYTYPVPYSGVANCMVCGGKEKYFPTNAEEVLICEECNSTSYCDFCDERISGTPYNIDGACLCDSCYYERTADCEQCGGTYLTENLNHLTVIGETNQTQESLREEIEKEATGRFYPSYYRRAVYRNHLDKMQLCLASEEFDDNIHLCDYCYRNGLNKVLRPGGVIHTKELLGEEKLCVFNDELTPEYKRDTSDFEICYCKEIVLD